MRKLIALAVLVLAGGCSDDVTAPVGVQEVEVKPAKIDPIPASYTAWWSELQACSAKSGDIGRVEFYADESRALGDNGRRASTVRGTPTYTVMERGADGVMRLRTIHGTPSVVTFFRGAKGQAGIVKHEMMHVLANTDEHPAQYFSGACGNLMP